MTLSFAVPPVIKDKEHVTNVSVLVNQLASLYCEVEGTPSPVIMWYKDDIQVHGDNQAQYAQFPASVPELNGAETNFFSVITNATLLF